MASKHPTSDGGSNYGKSADTVAMVPVVSGKGHGDCGEAVGTIIGEHGGGLLGMSRERMASNVPADSGSDQRPQAYHRESAPEVHGPVRSGTVTSLV